MGRVCIIKGFHSPISYVEIGFDKKYNKGGKLYGKKTSGRNSGI